MIITFTGKSCSGKSSLAKYLCMLDNRFTYISIDEVGHKVMEFEDVREETSKRLNIPLNFLNRKSLADAVFNSPEKMEILTDITWGKMQEIVDEFIKSNMNKLIILDWALMPKSKYFEMADINVLVDCPLDIRITRAIERDKIPKEKFMEREGSSMDYSSYTFDYTILNEDYNDAKRAVQKLYAESIVSG